ncbi:flagellar basal body rod protein FlgB [Telmatospirillum sp. J64-1]|uniref:flagellar basal body rod protein FlgB n=1 Tax=Telmatospirillum sp. J64-1 TaxID=2502183 RepID=UPI00115CE89C|nr:flagellar basal body rod protein FlgB [Telmatospirillum sp. J64-1]
MLNKLTLFQMARTRMDWVAKRQEVLAQNIANADTPKYQPRDVKALDFKSHLGQQPQVAAAVTNPRHVVSEPLIHRVAEVRKDGRPYESTIDGNAVVLEEQMVKLSEAKGAYDLAANLFQKHVKMIRTALGKGQG